MRMESVAVISSLTLSLLACAKPHAPSSHPVPSGAPSGPAKPTAQGKIGVKLAVQNHEGMLDAALTFTNQGSERVDLVKFVTLDDGQASNDLFVITHAGARVEYRGVMAKRGNPGPDGFYWLEPGQSIAGHLRLNDFYALPTSGELEIRYETNNHFAQHEQLLQSNSVTVSLGS